LEAWASGTRTSPSIVAYVEDEGKSESEFDRLRAFHAEERGALEQNGVGSGEKTLAHAVARNRASPDRPLSECPA